MARQDAVTGASPNPTPTMRLGDLRPSLTELSKTQAQAVVRAVRTRRIAPYPTPGWYNALEEGEAPLEPPSPSEGPT